MASLPHLKDADLTKPPFGTGNATTETCQEMCNSVSDCVVVNWHGYNGGAPARGGDVIVNHCHILTGKEQPTRIAFVKSLRNITGYTACMRS
jgi:hypothetical protein